MMKRLYLLFLCFTAISMYSQKNELDSIFVELDRAIANKNIYFEQKEQQIAALKKSFNMPNLTLEQRFQLNNDLYSEYQYNSPDSAVFYVYDNIRIAQELKNQNLLVKSKLTLIRYYSIKGLYINAVNALDSIRSDAYAQGLMTLYYSVYKQLYRFYFSANNNLPQAYFNYRDSLLMATDKNAWSYPYIAVEKMIEDGQLDEGKTLLLSLFEKAEKGSHLQAMLANSIGNTYKNDHNYQMQKKYFAIAAIGDIKNAVREHESFRSLAIACYETNDIERAYKYISQSMEDAMFTGFNMRKTEASQFFLIIQDAYQRNLQAEKDRFRHLMIGTSIIAFLLAIGIFYIYRQMNKVKIMRKNLDEINKQLNKLNEELVKVNVELTDANLLKETFITQFLRICSLYVNKMEKYQSNLNKKAMNRQLDDLYSMLKSRDIINNELKELYELFDSIFLNLYPDFVEKINCLLPEDIKFKVKKMANLSAELRIFALIRLGITNSAAIAEFLHCSVKTVYNYRAHIRNAALVSGEEFEERIKEIGKNNALTIK